MHKKKHLIYDRKSTIKKMLQVGFEPTTTASRAYNICIRAMLYQLSYWSKCSKSKPIHRTPDASFGNRTQDLPLIRLRRLTRRTQYHYAKKAKAPGGGRTHDLPLTSTGLTCGRRRTRYPLRHRSIE